MRIKLFFMVVSFVVTGSLFSADRDVSVRSYQKTDEKALVPIMKQYPEYLFLKEWGKGIEEQAAMAVKYLESSKYRTLVAVVNGQLVGFVNFIIVDSWFIGKVGSVVMLAVDSKHQRKGYASLLINKALEGMKKEQVAKAQLFVQSSNKTARAFYEKIGFNNEAPDIDKTGFSGPILYTHKF